MKDYHVFVSYSRKDDINFLNNTGRTSPVDQILSRFKKEGIKPWIDREGKYCGEEFQPQIQDALDNSEMVLFLSSKNSNDDGKDENGNVKAKWVRREILMADKKEKKIMSFCLDDTPYNKKISMIFVGKEDIKYYKDPQTSLNKLIENIKEHLAIVKLKYEIDNKRKLIINYIKKQQIAMKDLLCKEEELKLLKGDLEKKDCPVCKTPIDDQAIDYCYNCGWHYATPKELLPPEMQHIYDERLFASQSVWDEKEQAKKENHTLLAERGNLKEALHNTQKELSEIKQKYQNSLDNREIEIRSKQDELSKLSKELNNAKSQLGKALLDAAESSKLKQDINSLKSTEIEPLKLELKSKEDTILRLQSDLDASKLHEKEQEKTSDRLIGQIGYLQKQVKALQKENEDGTVKNRKTNKWIHIVYSCIIIVLFVSIFVSNFNLLTDKEKLVKKANSFLDGEDAFNRANELCNKYKNASDSTYYAFLLYRRAKDLGNKKSYGPIGTLYQKVNLDSALYYHRLAYNFFYENLQKNKNNEDDRKQMNKQAANMGDDYRSMKNDSNAIFWYKKAAENGNNNVLQNIGEIYDKKYTTKDSAFYYYLLALDKNDYSQKKEVYNALLIHIQKGSKNKIQKQYIILKKAGKIENRCFFEDLGLEPDSCK